MKTPISILFFFVLTSLFGQQNKLLYNEGPIYIVNKDYVIYQDLNERKIFHPDLESFRVINERRYYGIALDKNGIYFKGTFIDIDTTGIKIIGTNNIYPRDLLWKTEEFVFKNTERIEGIHAPSFSAVDCFNGGYFKDKNAIYFFDKKVDKSDGKTVNKTCDFELCYDKKQVYYKGETMIFKGEIVRPINDYLFKTKSHVINRNYEVLPSADPKTIRRVSKIYSLDKNHLYCNNDTVLIAPDNLKNLTFWNQYYSDGVSIYAGNGYLQKGLDVSTFGMLTDSKYFYDKNGLYKRSWDSKTESSFNEPFAFNYDSLLPTKNIYQTDYYIIYYNQAYNKFNKEIYYNLSTEELEIINKNELLQKDKTEPIFDTAYEENKLKLISHTPFVMNETNISYDDQIVISNKKLELLAIYQGYRRGCGSDPLFSTNFYFFKNHDGYWLIESTEDINPLFLGVTFDPTWNEAFSNFKLNE